MTSLAGPLDFLRNLVSSKETRAMAIGTAVQLFTGEAPIQRSGRDAYGDFLEISFTPAQVEKLRLALEGWMESDPGDVRVKVEPVLRPLILKKAAPWLLGSGALGAVAAFLGLRKK
jgi:hypothetical protein